MCAEDLPIDPRRKVPVVMVHDGVRFKVIFDEEARLNTSREEYEDSLK